MQFAFSHIQNMQLAKFLWFKRPPLDPRCQCCRRVMCNQLAKFPWFKRPPKCLQNAALNNIEIWGAGFFTLRTCSDGVWLTCEISSVNSSILNGCMVNPYTQVSRISARWLDDWKEIWGAGFLTPRTCSDGI